MSLQIADPNMQRAIRRRAYEIWQREGRPDGKSLEHWARAEAELGGQYAPQPVMPGPSINFWDYHG